MTIARYWFFTFLLMLNGYPLYSQDSLSFYFKKVQQKFWNGDRDGAIADMTRIITAYPTDSTYYFRGKLEVLHDPQGAIDDATKSLQLNPNQAKAYSLRGAAHERLSDFEQYHWPPQGLRDLDSAERDFSRAIEFETSVAEYADDYYQRAGVRCKLQRLNEALQDYNQYFILANVDSIGNPYPYYFRGFCRFNLHDYLGALEDGIKCQKMSPESDEGHELKALAEFALGYKKEACEEFSKFLKPGVVGEHNRHWGLFKEFCK